ncbi:unnamed protein product [Auanema sp. JU1783]|nr:unnamed protein product [Auanema sp. JU1783]
MASPRHDGSPEPPSLDVHRLESSGTADSDCVVMVKLTDELFTALIAAQKRKIPLSMRIEEKGGSFVIGDNSVFSFQNQPIQGETDTVCFDPRLNCHRTVGSYQYKYQVQATDKTFADTRERAQKLAEEENRKGAKDVNKHGRKHLSAPKSSRVGSASSSRHSSPLLSKASSDPQNRISPNKFSNPTGTNGLAPSANNGSSRPITHPLAAELRKKKLRPRIVHLVVTCRYSSCEEIHKKLRKDGLSEEFDDARKIEEIVREVAERSESGKYILKPALNSEVDSRWPWFTHEEKAYVRKVLSSSTQQFLASSSFAPMRKSGMERMQAPSASITQNISPEAIPTPPTSRPSSGGPPKTKTVSPVAQTRPSPAVTPAHEEIVEESVAGSSSKRKAHVPSSHHVDKRPRQDSSSPPEDPRSNQPSHKEKLMAARASGSTTSSRLSSPCSLSSPSQPSCDWEKTFPEIKDARDAEKYFSLYHSDYPIYMSCYKQLNKVAMEFKDLEDQLKNVVRVQRESSKIERSIQERFSQFEKDEEFLRCRQRHADLRSKLSVLKQRISDWERQQENSPCVL